MANCNIYYSDKYTDDEYEYRHVILPKKIARSVPTDRLMSEMEWRNLGITQSLGWVHYAIHKPETNVIMFRRPLTPEQLAEKAKERTEREKRIKELEQQGKIPIS